MATSVPRMIDELTVGVRERGEGMALGINEWAAALLYNGNGRYAEALAEDRAPKLPTRAGLEQLALVRVLRELSIGKGDVDAV